MEAVLGQWIKEVESAHACPPRASETTAALGVCLPVVSSWRWWRKQPGCGNRLAGEARRRAGTSRGSWSDGDSGWSWGGGLGVPFSSAVLPATAHDVGCIRRHAPRVVKKRAERLLLVRAIDGPPLNPSMEGGREETAMAGGRRCEVSVAEIRTGGQRMRRLQGWLKSSTCQNRRGRLFWCRRRRRRRWHAQWQPVASWVGSWIHW